MFALVVTEACGSREQLGAEDGDEITVGPGRGGSGVTANGGAAPVGVGGMGPGPSTVTVASGGMGPSTGVTVGTGPSTTVTVGTAGVGGMGPGTSVTVGTAGVGGMGPSTSVTVGAGGMGGGGPLDCLLCIATNCPSAQQCLQNPNCVQGLLCSIQNCNPPTFTCILNCFNGDFVAALTALQAIFCVFNQCSMECLGN